MRRISTGEYITAAGLLNGDALTSFSVSQYSTDTSSADFTERAFIWGSTGFKISEGTILVWSGGNLTIENMEIGVNKASVPDENFDFQTSNPFIQPLNHSVLEPSIDPYGIGRTVAIDFTNDPGKVYATYTSADWQHEIGLQDLVDNDINPVALSLAFSDLVGQLHSSGVVQYMDEGRMIVYGSSSGDVLDASSVKYPFWFDAPLIYGLTVVAGGGADTVSGTGLKDVVFAGTGDDTVYANGGDDEIYGRAGADVLFGGAGQDYIEGNDDADTIDGGDEDDRIFGDGGNDVLRGGDGADYIDGGEGNDTIYGGEGDLLHGGPGIDTFIFTSSAYGTYPVAPHIGDLEARDIIILDGFRIVGSQIVDQWTNPDPENPWYTEFSNLSRVFSWLADDDYGTGSESYHIPDLEESGSTFGSLNFSGKNKSGNYGDFNLTFDFVETSPAAMSYSYKVIGQPIFG